MRENCEYQFFMCSYINIQWFKALYKDSWSVFIGENKCPLVRKSSGVHISIYLLIICDWPEDKNVVFLGLFAPCRHKRSKDSYTLLILKLTCFFELKWWYPKP